MSRKRGRPPTTSNNNSDNNNNSPSLHFHNDADDADDQDSSQEHHDDSNDQNGGDVRVQSMNESAARPTSDSSSLQPDRKRRKGDGEEGVGSTSASTSASASASTSASVGDGKQPEDQDRKRDADDENDYDDDEALQNSGGGGGDNSNSSTNTSTSSSTRTGSISAAARMVSNAVSGRILGAPNRLFRSAPNPSASSESDNHTTEPEEDEPHNHNHNNDDENENDDENDGDEHEDQPQANDDDDDDDFEADGGVEANGPGAIQLAFIDAILGQQGHPERKLLGVDDRCLLGSMQRVKSVRSMIRRQRFGGAVSGLSPTASQRCNIFHLVASRQHSSRSSPSSSLLASESLLRRLRLSHVLLGHQGCVNTVRWNRDGTHIVSGSDDRHLNVYHVATRKLVKRFQTQHTHNIFNAHFLPQTDDQEFISCAADSTIRYHRPYTDLPPKVFRCHSKMVFKLQVSALEPNVVFSCSDDATVRQIDFRHHQCNEDTPCENCLVFLQSRVGGHAIGLNSIALNPVFPFQFAVAAADDVVRIYDRRMLFLSRRSLCQSVPVVEFTPSMEPRAKGLQGATSVVYNHDGTQVLASFANEHIYLFDATNFQVILDVPSNFSQDSNSVFPMSVDVIDERRSSSSSSASSSTSSSYSNWKKFVDPSFGAAGAVDEKHEHEHERHRILDVDDVDDDVVTVVQPAIAASASSSSSSSDESPSSVAPPPQASPLLIPSVAYLEAGAFLSRKDRTIIGLCAKYLSNITIESKSHHSPLALSPFEPVCRGDIFRYVGHRNMRTVKEVNFFGPHSEFVVSGSDDGHVFFWRKSDGAIIQLLHSDNEVVNVVQGNPRNCVFASSGIEQNVKLFEPIADERNHLDDLDILVQDNLSRLRRRTVPSIFHGLFHRYFLAWDE